jgi:hypothetical protein
MGNPFTVMNSVKKTIKEKKNKTILLRNRKNKIKYLSLG